MIIPMRLTNIFLNSLNSYQFYLNFFFYIVDLVYLLTQYHLIFNIFLMIIKKISLPQKLKNIFLKMIDLLGFVKYK